MALIQIFALHDLERSSSRSTFRNAQNGQKSQLTSTLLQYSIFFKSVLACIDVEIEQASVSGTIMTTISLHDVGEVEPFPYIMWLRWGHFPTSCG